MRANLLSYVDNLPRHALRDAYLWKEGARWRRRTYGEIHDRILGCAATLAAAGVKPGDHVLIQGPDGADWVEAFFGILRSGAVAVPLDAAAPEEFRLKVSRKVASRHLVARPGVAPPPESRLVALGDWPLGGHPPPVAPRGEDRAEVVFTSGTTGEPRGVVLTHANLASDFAPIERGFRKRERLVRLVGRAAFVSVLPMSHMFGQAMNVFLPLAMGLTVVLAPPKPHEAIEAARRHRAWGLFAVPRFLDLLAAEIRSAVRGQWSLEALERRQRRVARWPWYLQALAFPRVQRRLGWRFRLIVSGGAPLSEPTQRFFESSGFLVVQGYGLTETAPIVSLSNPFEKGSRSVGRPIGDQRVTIGPSHEVLVRGPNVTPGYVGEKRAADAGGWLPTGDIGELDAAGRLRISGRLKDVIVTPEGENVHAVDVEAAFAGLPGVFEACVIGVPVDGGDSVHAALMMDAGADADEAVRAANRRLQPKQRVRGHTVWPDRDFPRTAIGKVRKGEVRERLLAIRAAAPIGRTAHAGQGGVRTLVAQVARVGEDRLNDGMRPAEDLGLSSLDLVEISVAIEDRFGVSLPEETIGLSTLGEMERMVMAWRAGAGAIPSGGPRSGGPAPTPASIAAAAPRGPAPRPPRWARRFGVHLTRRLVEEVFFSPLVRLYARPHVSGLENLPSAGGPFLFVSNHHSHLDSGLFKILLPRPVRGRIAPGMTTRYHRIFFGYAQGSFTRAAIEWIQVRLVQGFFHAWPLPEQGGVRESLSCAGELADAGFSLLVFPEGRHVPEGSSEPFREGIGLFARELRMPVIPAWVEGTASVLPQGAWWLRRGRTRLTLGPPLAVEPDADAAKTTRRIEAAVRALSRPGRT